MGEELDEVAEDLIVAKAFADFLEELEVVVEAGHVFGEIGAGELRAGLAFGDGAVGEDHAVGSALDHDFDVLALVLDVLLELTLLDAEERGLGDVDVAALDELGHVAEEEGEQQGADVRAVDVGVGHQDELAVAQLARGRSRPCRCRSRGR